MIADEIESKKAARDAMLQFALEYKEKRDAALSGENEEELKNKLEAIRKHSIASLDEMKTRAITSLQANGFKVYGAKDEEGAIKIIQGLLGEEELIVKSKSNVLDEIRLKEHFPEKDIVETDLGDFINQVTGNEDMHPVIPALNLTPEEIADAIKKKFKIDVEPDAESIMAFAREYLREKIKAAKIGMSGANVITAEGSVVTIENEGNISLVSRMPEKHIIVAGMEKIVENIDEAMHVAKCCTIWGTGQKLPSYISVISGPSKTGDIQNRHITGAQGAKEVHIIFLDNGRTDMINEGFGELLQCIGCGACLNFCPVFHQVQTGFGCDALGGIKGVALQFVRSSHKAAFDCGAFYCLGCQACKVNCPANILFGKHMLKIKAELVKEGLEPEASKKMAEKSKATGNPFGNASGNPKELYCC